MKIKNDEEYLWLEEVEGSEALDWVNNHNDKTKKELMALPLFPKLKEQSLKILQDQEKVPYGVVRGEYLYNLWRDEHYKQGLLRRIKVEDFKDDGKWEEVLDLDQLSAKENENWVYKGMTILDDDNGTSLIFLSRGGKDAFISREFDLKEKKFIENGFSTPEAKNSIVWIDSAHLILGADFDDECRTDSGYARKIKIWNRSESFESLSNKDTVLEISKEDMGLFVYRLSHQDTKVNLIHHAIDFYTRKLYVVEGQKAIQINIPIDADLLAYFDNKFIFHLRSEWNVGGKFFPADTVLSATKEDLTSGNNQNDFEIVFSPTDERVFQEAHPTAQGIFLTVLENVIGKVLKANYDQSRGWSLEEVPLPQNGNARVLGNSGSCRSILIEYENFTSPSKVFRFDDNLEQVFSLKEKFNSDEIEVRQVWVTSADGEKVPYFLCGKNLDQGEAPTLLYGYGGFQISLQPTYNANIGRLWLERGGRYALSNIRGGGEFGARWHKSSLKKNRHKCYEDFEAIARDLISKGQASSESLAISGGSNGGLLMGAMLTRCPELFKAVLCDVPLLDMIRYTKLLAGASWAAEYGDPEESEEMKNYILSYSPFHNLDPKTKYPRSFFYTSTKDDRVHPGHARKMAAKMIDQGHDVLYLENLDGGHGRNVDLEKTAEWLAMRYAFLWDELSPNT